MLPQGIIMPSHFSESTGELVVACDASGSMWGILPTVFGEIARICENVRPEQVRVLFWEYEIVGEQIFKPQDYDKIADLLKPCGGGGTRLTCVAEYLQANKIKPKATIILSDGYIENDYILPEGPTLFGSVDNDHFVAHTGKTIRIYSN
jgi:predicted metal-dependent peptidase